MKSSVTLSQQENFNKVILSDCLDFLKNIPSSSIDLIYLDPPFFTQKKHNLKSKEGREYSFIDCWDSREDYLF